MTPPYETKIYLSHTVKAHMANPLFLLAMFIIQRRVNIHSNNTVWSSLVVHWNDD